MLRLFRLLFLVAVVGGKYSPRPNEKVSKFTISGYIANDASWFRTAVCIKDNPTMCPLTMHVVFPERVTILNYRHDDNRGQPVLLNQIPFQRCQRFELEITIEDSAFKIVANRQYFTVFKRHIGKGLHFDHICNSWGDGSTSVDTISVKVRKIAGGNKLPRSKVVVRYFDEGLKYGTDVKFKGYIPKHARNFGTSLCQTPLEKACALFMNVTYINHIVKLDVVFGQRHYSHSTFAQPMYKRDNHFEVVLKNDEFGYKIFFNDQFLLHVNHSEAIPPNSLHFARCAGHVYDLSIAIEKNPYKPSYHDKVIEKGLDVGDVITIKGTIPNSTNRFRVSLCNGTCVEDYCDLIIDVSYKYEAVVLTNRIAKGFHAVKVDHVPFRKGQQFELRIKAEHDSYEVSVNSEVFAHFKSSEARTDVKYIRCAAPVQVDSIDVKGHLYLNGPFTSENPKEDEQSESSTILPESSNTPEKNYGPQDWTIDGGMKLGTEVVIKIVDPTGSRKFEITLCTEPLTEGDCALIMEVSYEDSLIHLNNRQNGSFDTPEQFDIIPEQKNRDCEIWLKTGEYGFNISVNNHLLSYPHRMSTHNVHYLTVSSNVKVKNITFHEFEFSKEGIWVNRLNLKLAGPIYKDYEIEIYSYPAKNTKWFWFGFCEDSDATNCTLVIEVFYDQNKTAIYDKRNRIWDTLNYLNNPIQASKSLNMSLIISDSGYKIQVNKRHLCDFKHGLPLSTVKYFNYAVDDTFYFKDIRIKKTFPDIPNAESQLMQYYADGEYGMEMTFFPNELYPGRNFIIRGVPKYHTQEEGKASITLKEYGHYSTLHIFKIELNFEQNMTTIESGFFNRWYPESTCLSVKNVTTQFPFELETVFTMKIKLESSQIKIDVNGKYYTHFFYRLKPSSWTNQKLDRRAFALEGVDFY